MIGSCVDVAGQNRSFGQRTREALPNHSLASANLKSSDGHESDDGLVATEGCCRGDPCGRPIRRIRATGRPQGPPTAGDVGGHRLRGPSNVMSRWMLQSHQIG